MRTVGVEEEFLLVDAQSGLPVPVAAQVLEEVDRRTACDQSSTNIGGSIGHEFHQQQLETATSPHVCMEALQADVRSLRAVAIAGARKAGARLIAAGTSPMLVQPRVVSTPRFANVLERFGLTAAEQLVCGCHVHLSVSSDAEAVAVLDRIRIWLPAILALSANSPFWQGHDSQYASYRSQVLARWPTAGPQDLFGSAAHYHRQVASMVASGTILDEAMVYFDARLSHRFPTVEIRIADVCLDASHTVLIAALCRGLVDTAATQWKRTGAPAPAVPTSMLRLATWQAARAGITGNLLDPYSGHPRPARRALSELVEHLRPALQVSGDEQLVNNTLAHLLENGNGAARQRAVWEQTGQLADVVTNLVAHTQT